MRWTVSLAIGALLFMHFVKAVTKPSCSSMTSTATFVKRKHQGYHSGLKTMMRHQEAKIPMISTTLHVSSEPQSNDTKLESYRTIRMIPRSKTKLVAMSESKRVKKLGTAHL